jgi:hypothetical protein
LIALALLILAAFPAAAQTPLERLVARAMQEGRNTLLTTEHASAIDHQGEAMTGGVYVRRLEEREPGSFENASKKKASFKAVPTFSERSKAAPVGEPSAATLAAQTPEEKAKIKEGIGRVLSDTAAMTQRIFDETAGDDPKRLSVANAPVGWPVKALDGPTDSFGNVHDLFLVLKPGPKGAAPVPERLLWRRRTIRGEDPKNGTLRHATTQHVITDLAGKPLSHTTMEFIWRPKPGGEKTIEQKIHRHDLVEHAHIVKYNLELEMTAWGLIAGPSKPVLPPGWQPAR